MKQKPLLIPNKKVNYSKQYRNLQPGTGIGFEHVDDRVDEINSDVAEALKVKTPVVVQEVKTIVATCATPGATIFYTTDGSTPNELSTKYTGPVSMNETVTLRFVAFKNGMVGSDEAAIEFDTSNYFYFEADEDNAVVNYRADKLTYTVNLEKSTDKKHWETVDFSKPVTLAKKGDRVYYRGTNDVIGGAINTGFRFIVNDSIGAYGDITCLLNPEGAVDTFAKSWVFEHLFSGCSGLTHAPELPTTSISLGCYFSMFVGCSRLTTAPVLPAISLKYACYSNMFLDCTGLTVAPELPATSLNAYCYDSMFKGCTGLTVAPELPATTLSDSCYENMFWGCTGLTVAPELPATSLDKWCYSHMFKECTGLTTAPQLPVTQLYDYCYDSMFVGCTGLRTAPELPATTLANYCYYDMFLNCTGLTAAPELPATTLADYCYCGMFLNCTGLTTAPELPATTLAGSCYREMFWGCTGLTAAPELPATTLAGHCYFEMFFRCTGLTASPELPATTLVGSCYERMFFECQNLVSAPNLPASTLVDSCYKEMFDSCSSLNYVKCLAEDISATNCTARWIGGASQNGTFVKSAQMASWPIGYGGIPSGWTVIVNQ